MSLGKIASQNEFVFAKLKKIVMTLPCKDVNSIKIS